jgi:ribosomal peptide maturation radical SAM protein 1
MEYRSKSPQRALAEIDDLTKRYGVRKVYVVDNILDLRYFDTVLRELAERPRPPRLFYETKANLTKDQLRLLRRAGVWGIQPGIESLSTPILRLMDKGVTGLQNVRLLKWCREIGLEAEWNFLAGFPGEDPSEYPRLARLVPSLTHLQPPGGPGQIRLDRFSPYFREPARHGMVNVRASLAYRHIYPFPQRDIDRLAYYFDYDYADGRAPAVYIAELKREVSAWQEAYPSARLELCDDGERLEIDDSRPCAQRDRWVLEGFARLAYLGLDAGNTATGLREQLLGSMGEAAPDAETLAGLLDTWRRQRLIFQEGARYVSLAIDPRGRVTMPVERFLMALAGETA